MSLEQDDVFRDFFEEGKQTKKKKKGRKLKSTDLMITLNLNEKFTNMTTEQKRAFRQFAVDLFDKKQILSFFKDRENPSNPLANMQNVEIKWRPEVGPQQGKLHLHALVAITHTGFYTFKANELRSFATQTFGHNIYLSCPVSSNERVKWESYLQKGVQE